MCLCLSLSVYASAYAYACVSAYLCAYVYERVRVQGMKYRETQVGNGDRQRGCMRMS